MSRKRLADNIHFLDEISMVADLFVPRYKIYAPDPADEPWDYDLRVEVLHERAPTWGLLAAMHSPELIELQTDHSCSVTDISLEEWFMTRVEGPRAFVLAVAAAAEALGATRAPA